jgi:hypothetical protein
LPAAHAAATTRNPQAPSVAQQFAVETLRRRNLCKTALTKPGEG